MADWTIKDIPEQSGKLAVVTGATGGLGLETALALAGAGAEVVLAARNADKGCDALASILDRHPQTKARFEQVDLASLASVHAFAGRMLDAARPIDILINNAGIMALPKRRMTADGHEMQFGTNYLSHFALTARLLPLLTAARARVVQLSSIAHREGRIQLGDLNYEASYRAWPVYAQSKLAMLMFAIELQRRSDANGWGLTSVASHPGVARSDLVSNGYQLDEGGLSKWVTRTFVNLLGQSVARGALPTLMAATLPGVTPGGYYGPQGLQELRGRPGPARLSAAALDQDTASRLWSEAEGLTGVSFG